MSREPKDVRAAVVLAGGEGRRLGGVDKAALVLGQQALLVHAVSAAAQAARDGEVVVVGPRRTRLGITHPVTWAREDPPGGGPAAGLLAGVEALTRPAATVLVRAVDMPWCTAATLERLLAALASSPEADGAQLYDARGRPQPLAAAYRTSALRAVGQAEPARRHGPAGMALRDLLTGLELVGVPAQGREADDVDTPDDLSGLSERSGPDR